MKAADCCIFCNARFLFLIWNVILADTQPSRSNLHFPAFLGVRYGHVTKLWPMGYELKHCDGSVGSTLQRNAHGLLYPRAGVLPQRWATFRHKEEAWQSKKRTGAIQFAYTQTSMTETNFVLSNTLFLFRQLGLCPDKCSKCNLERMIQCSPGRLLPILTMKHTSSIFPLTSLSTLLVCCLPPQLWLGYTEKQKYLISSFPFLPRLTRILPSWLDPMYSSRSFTSL